MPDEHAWRAFLDLHSPFVLALARDRLRRAGADGIQAEDLAQEVWTGLLAGGWETLGDPRSYLAVAVLNAFRKHLRENRRRRAREQARPIPEAPSWRPEEAEEALRLLPPEDRLLLRWIYWDALSYADVARLSGMKENSVGPALSHAREKLKAVLEKEKAARK